MIGTNTTVDYIAESASLTIVSQSQSSLATNIKNITNQSQTTSMNLTIPSLNGSNTVNETETIDSGKIFKSKLFANKLNPNTHYIIDDNLNLNSNKLTKLVCPITIKGNLILANSPLTTLPNALKIDGYMEISNCCFITSLPTDLKISGHIKIYNCPITSLPNALKINGDMEISNCPITSLPDNLTGLGGNIKIENCHDFTSLPNSITQLGALSDGTRREVSLLYTGLSEEIIEKLQTKPAEGMQFHISMLGATDYRQFNNLNQALTFWSALTKKGDPIPSMDHLIDSQILNLKTYLERLTTTADFKNIHSQQMLAIRVIDMLSLLDANNSNFPHAIATIEAGLLSCEDRIIQALDNLELYEKQQNAIDVACLQNDSSQLIELAQQMLHLETIKDIAHEHAKKLTYVDHIEIILSFQIGLQKKGIALPTSTQSILHSKCAHVYDTDLQQAKETIQQRCDQKALNQYLKTWAPYQIFMRSQAIPAFDQLPTTQVESIEECPIFMMDKEQMLLSQGYQISYEALKRCHTDSGKHPLTREPIDWNEVQQLSLIEK